jgi:hypothetical protein
MTTTSKVSTFTENSISLCVGSIEESLVFVPIQATVSNWSQLLCKKYHGSGWVQFFMTIALHI